MGIGSFLSKYVGKNVMLTFVQVELLIGVVGGSSAAILFMLFEHVEHFRVLLYAIVAIIGILVGLEVPLLMRILKDRLEFKDLVSQVFTFDYVGALLASLCFPLVLVPHLGLLRSSFLFGLLNVLVALWTMQLLQKELPWRRSLQSVAVVLIVFLVCGFAFSEKITTWSEASAFQDPVIYAASTPYQRIVITGGGKDIKLFLNGNLQFNSRDEYRYHEALIHPAMASLDHPQKVLVLGGGDGMAVREILKYQSVRNITLIDLDSQMTNLFKEQLMLTRLNGDSLNDAKVHVLNQDAFVWLKNCAERFDLIVVDFPDPSNFSLGKLYSDTFYRSVKRALNPQGIAVIQSTSPYFAKNSYWCVVNTLNSIGLRTTPYHAYVPSFGDWGYVMASPVEFKPATNYPQGLKFISAETVAPMLTFPSDMQPTVQSINKLNNQTLVHLFESEWGEYVETH